MAEVLVLAEHTDGGEVKKVTVELLTAARRLGSPSVVWTGPGADGARDRLAEFGADKVYVADSAGDLGYVPVPLVQLVASLSWKPRWIAAAARVILRVTKVSPRRGSRG